MALLQNVLKLRSLDNLESFDYIDVYKLLIYMFSPVYPSQLINNILLYMNMLLLMFAVTTSLNERGRVMVFNAAFNNISAISLLPVLLVEETGVPGDLLQVTDKFSHIMLYQVYLAMSRILTHNISGDKRFDCTGICKSDYHTIMTQARTWISNTIYHGLFLCSMS